MWNCSSRSESNSSVSSGRILFLSRSFLNNKTEEQRCCPMTSNRLKTGDLPLKWIDQVKCERKRERDLVTLRWRRRNRTRGKKNDERCQAGLTQIFICEIFFFFFLCSSFFLSVVRYTGDERQRENIFNAQMRRKMFTDISSLRFSSWTNSRVTSKRRPISLFLSFSLGAFPCIIVQFVCLN